MPRIARLVLKGEKTVYHVMSRTALEGYVLGRRIFCCGIFVGWG